MTVLTNQFDIFHVGEIAILWMPGVDDHGRELVITTELQFGPFYDMNDDRMHFGPFYIVEGYNEESPGTGWCEQPCNLRKKRPPGEDLKVVRWDQCPWQPETIHV
jgi:hypothetical protein